MAAKHRSRNVLTALVVLAFGIVTAACDDSAPSSQQTEPTNQSEATGPARTSAPSTPGADAVQAACDHFLTFWQEFAQLDSGPKSLNPTPDPHSERATAAIEAAFASAARGTPDARSLGEIARKRYNAGSAGPFFTSVVKFVDLCGKRPPELACAPRTVCESQRMNEFARA